MKVIGKTLEGDLIIQVSQAEWDSLGNGIKPSEKKFYDTEIYRLLSTAKLQGIAWRRFRNAFDDGKMDGTTEQLRLHISEQMPYLYVIGGIGQKGLDRIYKVLSGETER